MRKIILSVMISLDGFIESRDKDLSWHNWSKEMDEFMTQFFKGIDTIILGRIAYELMASYWPTAAAGSENPLIAHKMNRLNKIVFSERMNTADWRNTKIFPHLSAKEILKIKQQDGKDLVIFGGAKIASAFMALDLIDEFQLIVNPVLLGKGTLLFSEDYRKQLVLIKSECHSGNIILHYRSAP